MSNIKHTSKPWHIYDPIKSPSPIKVFMDNGTWFNSKSYYIASDGRKNKIIGEITYKFSPGKMGGLPGVSDLNEFEANAHLIASAPELYEALNDMVYKIPSEETQKKAIAALRKAEGKT